MTTEPNNKSSKKNPVGRFMVAAGAVIEFKTTGKILLVQRNKKLDWHPGEWEICYGRIDQFEDAEQGLKREVKEELGLNDLTVLEVLRVWHIYRGSKKAENEVIGITYHCKTNTEKITLSSEHSNVQWATPQKAIELIANDGIKKDIEVYMNGNKNKNI